MQCRFNEATSPSLSSAPGTVPRNAHGAPDSRHNANWQKSKNWVGALANRFREHYPPGPYRIFWSGNKENQKEFGRNEFLFDLAVCSVSTTKSLERHPKDLEFIAQCHWLIESEFSLGSTRDIVIDMSKLVMGSAENKLFFAAHRGHREKDILRQCSEIARCCNGRVYFGFVSHPNEWKPESEQLPALHEWTEGGWAEIPLPSRA